MLMSQIAPFRAFTGASVNELHHLKTYSFLEKEEVIKLIKVHGDKLMIDIWDGQNYKPLTQTEYNDLFVVGFIPVMKRMLTSHEIKFNKCFKKEF